MAGVTQPETGPVDEPPADGVFRDWDGAQLEPAVVELGNALGLSAVDYVEDADGQVTVL